MVDQTNEVKPAPGYYEARIANYGVKKTKAGDPAPTIVFEVSVDGVKQRVFWQGSLKDGQARDITLKALAVCGFKNVRSFANLADGISSGLLDMDKDVQITVEHETSQDGSGKRFARVRWVNEAGGGKFKDAIDLQEATVLMQGMNLEADFMRIAQEGGYKVSNELISNSGPKAAKEVPDLDIPF